MLVADEFYIRPTSSGLDHRTHVLKHGDSFAVLDRAGNIAEAGSAGHGLFHQDTRFLSCLALRVSAAGREPGPPLLLSSSAKAGDAILYAHLANPPMQAAGAEFEPDSMLHMLRMQVLWHDCLCERLQIRNYSGQRARFSLAIVFEADFADIFEVRGMPRRQRGRLLPPQVRKHEVVLGYEGLDRRRRRTSIIFEAPPASLSATQAVYEMDVPPRGQALLRWTVHCGTEAAGLPIDGQAEGRAAQAARYEVAEQQVHAEMAAAQQAEPEFTTSNELFNDCIARSLADLRMLATDTPHGQVPYAGVPWFSTSFGRDGAIVALQCLWFAPQIARGVLSFLAATQSDVHSDEQDAHPGKILHEARNGEMAATGEVPFGRYYGSVDATPLFLMLGGAYLRRTGDTELVRQLWPNFERALRWVDQYGDADQDGLVEYARKAEHGLSNQGWKDSWDAVFHADGSLAEAPIALCEVQGYVYAGKIAAAAMARALGMQVRAESLLQQARELQRRFESAFWCEQIGTYALALDRHKRCCRVPASNAGHCLFTGIATPGHARRVMETLMSESFFSGWGVRTVASGAARYNPMSYHNGSVWPHDNSIIAAGLGRFGHRGQAATILGSLFEASLRFEMYRLPELFCGFRRHRGEGPTVYPQACSPQAWSAAAPLLCLQACLGLQVCGAQGKVFIRDPALPAGLDHIRIRRLRLPQGTMDIEITRHGQDVGVRLAGREGDVELVISL